MKKYISLILAILLCVSIPVISNAVLQGDVNGDGKVTASDARLVLRHSIKLEAIENIEAIADINADGKITASDARLVLRIAAKLNTQGESGYLFYVRRNDTAIYSEPSYDGKRIGVIYEKTNYTIVKETRDEEGNVWGKLKSGLGWIDLTKAREDLSTQYPLAIDVMSSPTFKFENYLDYTSNDEYAINVVLVPNETITNVVITYGNMTDEIEDVYKINRITPDKPLVAGLFFGSDFVFYTVRFTDKNGEKHSLTIAESARNGEIKFL